MMDFMIKKDGKLNANWSKKKHRFYHTLKVKYFTNMFHFYIIFISLFEIQLQARNE